MSQFISRQSPVQTYDQLVHAIRETMALSQKRIDQAIDQEKVREAWEIGKMIREHVLQHKERAGYGQQVLKRLAHDLSMSDTELGYMMQFFNTYPISPPAGKLSWSHYRELLSLNDEKERREMAEQAERETWGRDRVREEVSKRQVRGGAPNQSHQLISTPGILYTYRMVKAVAGPLKDQWVVDLGFANYFQPEEIGNIQEGDIVLSEKGKPKKVEASEQDLWTYQAYVTQVTDGDTFDAVVDLGFKITTLQKLRLRGLDAPEIESAQGREAKAFLEKNLSRNGGVVLIKTMKSDKYDRYLADVFVGDVFINQLLLDEGFAEYQAD